MLHVQLDYFFRSQSIIAWICRAVLLFAVAVVVYLAFDILDVQSGLQNRYNRNSYSINTLIRRNSLAVSWWTIHS